MRRLRRQLELAVDVAAAKVLGRHRPLSIGWEVTTLCNAACVYCAFRDASDGELSTDEALVLVREMHECGTRMVSLSGGEPLTRKDLSAIVGALRERDIAVSINTNGFLVPRHEELIRSVQRVKISIDGPEPIHDRVRGAGTWKKAVRGIERCLGWSVPVAAEAVLGKTNLPYLADLVDWCASMRLPLQVQPADPFVLNGDQPNPEAPEPEPLHEAIRRLIDDRPPGLLNSVEGLHHLLRYPKPTAMKCASGQITARVGATGVLRLCGVPPASAPAPSWREHGLREAFRRLHAVPCDRCWCAPRIDVNLGYQGRNLLSIARGRVTGILPGARPAHVANA